eukprot:CAMPEP_0116025756 /NCGR_PEP_ID=MMETSP0321-20121206/13301_1 /TAXON_ID=163516 /ORGANISM="Leptocylindrus danicus var. danicus, Strain B650" /LENGTH=246 /DNA_ID=CAMNT_0003498137 /DNA_START=36 /DNA_END=776 /DNA_ORIENTATION=-
MTRSEQEQELKAQHYSNDEAPPNKNTNTNTSDGRFDCNICLDAVSEPVVTQCGHLYCWVCLYQWLSAHPNTNTSTNTTHAAQNNCCPVCKAHTSLDTIVPLYVRGDPQQQQQQQQQQQSATHDCTSNNNSVLRRRRCLPAAPMHDVLQHIPPRPLPNVTATAIGEHMNDSVQLRQRRSRHHHRNRMQHQEGGTTISYAYEEQQRVRADAYDLHLHVAEGGDDETTEFLSRLLLILGSVVVLCLLLF